MHRTWYYLIVNSILVLFATLGVRAAAAQVAPGARVRVRVDSPPPPHQVVGIVRSMDADALTVAPVEGGAVQRIPLSAIGNLEVSRGRGVVGSHVIIGAGIGALAGGAIAAATSSCSSHEFFCFEGLAIAGGALLGGATGAVVGALIKGEKWQSVPLQPQVAVAPLPRGGVGVALTVAF